MESDKKICSVCKEEKEKLEFNKNSSRKDRLQTLCKKCSRLKSKKFYYKNVDLHKKNVYKYKLKKIIENQQFIFDYKKSKGCIDCKENDPSCLDFDHIIKPKTNLISRMVASCVSIKSILNEIEKCVIRCANCHRKKTSKDFNWYKNLNVIS